VAPDAEGREPEETATDRRGCVRCAGENRKEQRECPDKLRRPVRRRSIPASASATRIMNHSAVDDASWNGTLRTSE
jgi:hypothetical protein